MEIQRICVRPQRLLVVCIVVALLSFTEAIKAEWFEDVTSTSGMAYSGSSYGASWGDSNGDGFPDLFISNHAVTPPMLFNNNRDGTFSDSTVSVPYQIDDMHGSSWVDFDNDGDQDLLVLVGAQDGAGSGANQFYINIDNRFQEMSRSYGLDYPAGRGRTPLWFDWNSDGKLDVLILNWKRSDGQAPTALFTQSGGGFLDSFPDTGFAALSDNNYAQLIGLGNENSSALAVHRKHYPDRIYDYSGTPFLDLNAASGIFPANIYNAQDTAVADFDGDLKPDIFLVLADNNTSELLQLDPVTINAVVIVNVDEKGFTFSGGSTLQVQIEPSFRIKPENIFIGSQAVHPVSSTFELVSSDPDVAGMPAHTPGVNYGVYIGYDPEEGLWQFMASKSSWLGANFIITASDPVTNVVPVGFVNSDGGKSDKLLLQGSAGFVDHSTTAGLTVVTPCEGVSAADFDNDMDIDLYLVCRGPASNRSNVLYENMGNATFQVVPDAGGASGSSVGRGDAVASADYDGDGFIDLLITNGLGSEPFNHGPNQLFRNIGNANHWLEIDLEGVKSNRDGIGAKVLATTGGITQYRLQGGGMHRFSQDDKRVHFGLGGHTQVDSLTVEWPGGEMQTITNIPADELVHVLEPSTPSLMGKPDYVPGQDAGFYLWKDSFDGPYHIEVNSDGPLSVFSVELISDQALLNVTPRSLEAGDTLIWNVNHMMLEGRVTTWFDGVDFSLPPHSRAMLAVSRDGVPNPRQLHIGALGEPLTPAGWILEADSLSVLPEFQAGADLGLFVGLVEGEVQTRWNGDGNNHHARLELLFSQQPVAVTPVSLEVNDVFLVSDNSVSIDGYISTWWDGVNLDLSAGTRLGLSYIQDGLTQPNRVNPSDRNLGSPGAYILPVAKPYGAPVFDVATDAKLFIWKNEASGRWRVMGTAGGEYARYTGELVSSLPLSNVVFFSLEENDTFDTTDPRRIVFDLLMWQSGVDGFAFEVPEGAIVQLNLQPQGTADPAEALKVGNQRWPVKQLPLDISGW